MATNRPDLDLLELAEDIVGGRRSLANVIDQIAVATPDDVERRRRVAEVQSLVVGLGAVHAHARATADAGASVSAADERLAVAPQRLAPRHERPRTGFGPLGLARGLAALGTVVVGVVVVAVVVGSLRSTPSVGGPSPSAENSGSTAAVASSSASPVATVEASTASSTASASPSASAAEPTSTPTPGAGSTPTPTPAPSPSASSDIQPFAGAPGAAFWSVGVVPNRITVWFWSPSSGGGLRDRGLRDRVDLDAWTDEATSHQVVVSPDGKRIAVTEFTGPGSARNRTRVFSVAGKLLWSSPAGMAPTQDVAWSAEGSYLALGAIPGPWTVVSFDAGGNVSTNTYELPNDQAYRLLAFGPDNTILVGYETSGEAEFWQKPAMLNLHMPMVSNAPNVGPIDGFPGGLVTNATTWHFLDQVNPKTGALLALSGVAKGTPEWILRQDSTDQKLAITPDRNVAWADADTILAVGPAAPLPTPPTTATPPPDNYVGIWAMPAAGGPLEKVASFPGLTPTNGAGYTPVDLVSARNGWVMVYVGAPQCCVGVTEESGGYTQVTLVNVHDAAGVAAIAPAGTTFYFAGWLPD